MGDDHYPRLEKIIAPRIGPAATARSSATVVASPSRSR